MSKRRGLMNRFFSTVPIFRLNRQVQNPAIINVTWRNCEDWLTDSFLGLSVFVELKISCQILQKSTWYAETPRTDGFSFYKSLLAGIIVRCEILQLSTWGEQKPRTDRLIDSFLRFSFMENGNQPQNPAITDLRSTDIENRLIDFVQINFSISGA